MNRQELINFCTSQLSKDDDFDEIEFHEETAKYGFTCYKAFCQIQKDIIENLPPNDFLFCCTLKDRVVNNSYYKDVSMILGTISGFFFTASGKLVFESKPIMD